jgi:hypothetical protein
LGPAAQAGQDLQRRAEVVAVLGLGADVGPAGPDVVRCRQAGVGDGRRGAEALDGDVAHVTEQLDEPEPEPADVRGVVLAQPRGDLVAGRE